MAENFVTVAKADELNPGEMMYVEVGDEPVCLINLDGEYFALNDICTHQDASLSDGTIDGEELECPLHGGVFNVEPANPSPSPSLSPWRPIGFAWSATKSRWR